MPRRDDKDAEALNRLDERLDAFDKARASKATGANALGAGYRLVAELIGGVLTGAAAGWGVDVLSPRLTGVHTQPWGVAVGLAIGAGVSVWFAARTAQRMGAAAPNSSGPAPAADDDD